MRPWTNVKKTKANPGVGFCVTSKNRDYLARPSTKSTSFSMSASATRGEYGGIGAPPVTSVQLPLPPFFTFSTRRALAPASPGGGGAAAGRAGPAAGGATEGQAK